MPNESIVACFWMLLVATVSRVTISAFSFRSAPRIRSLARFVTSSSKKTDSSVLLLGQVQIPVDLAIAQHGAPDVVFVDGSWWLVNRETTSRQDFERGPRILNSVFFDIEDICSPAGSAGNPKGLPHMMPTDSTFAAAMDAMGIRNSDHVIVYGQQDCPFLHRAWFQFACMGHDYDRVHLLGGSLTDWIIAGGPIDEGPATAIRAADLDTSVQPNYQAVPARNVVDMEEVKQLVKPENDDGTILVDARSPDRFHGRVDEPRPGLRLGHMPGARNLFFFDLLEKDSPNKLKPREELERILKAKLGNDAISSSDRIVSTCGSGATACTLAAALISCGKDPSKVFIYDGSWCEWGADSNSPVIKD